MFSGQILLSPSMFQSKEQTKRQIFFLFWSQDMKTGKQILFVNSNGEYIMGFLDSLIPCILLSDDFLD